MAYEKQTWQTVDTITADKLNHMEDGINNSSQPPEKYAYDIMKDNLTPELVEQYLSEGKFLFYTYYLENENKYEIYYLFDQGRWGIYGVGDTMEEIEQYELHFFAPLHGNNPAAFDWITLYSNDYNGVFDIA